MLRRVMSSCFCSTLRKLILVNTNITGMGVRHLVDALASSLQPNNVTVLVLDNNPVQSCHDSCSARAPVLTQLVALAWSRRCTVPHHCHPAMQTPPGALPHVTFISLLRALIYPCPPDPQGQQVWLGRRRRGLHRSQPCVERVSIVVVHDTVSFTAARTARLAQTRFDTC